MKLQKNCGFVCELRFPMNVMVIQFSSKCWHAHIGPRCFKSSLQLSNGGMWVTLFPYLLFSWSLCDSFDGHLRIELLLYSRPSKTNKKKSSCSCWIEQESFGDGLMVLTRLMGGHHPLTECPRISPLLLTFWSLWNSSGLVGSSLL